MTSRRLLDIVARLSHCASSPALMTQLQQAAGCLGFEHYLLWGEQRLPAQQTCRFACTDCPDAWLRAYQGAGGLQRDPVLARARTSRQTLRWDELRRSSLACARDLWDSAQAHGLVHGLSLGVHGRGGVFSLLSMGGRTELPARGGAQWRRLRQSFGLLAELAHVGLQRALVEPALNARRGRFSDREADCLRWAAQGKTSWEMACILDISESTAVFHLTNAMHKLGVSNRLQAVAVAGAIGLLDR